MLSKCKVDCPIHHREGDKRGREFEITPEGRVWPCCYYANAWEKRGALTDPSQEGYNEASTLLKDPIYEVLKTDPNFNHLDHNDLNSIIQHQIFWETIYYPGWESDNVPFICKENCSVVEDEQFGSHGKSLLEASKLIKGGDND